MKILITMLLSFSMALPLWSQDIAAFSGTKNPTTATVPNITAEALSRGPGLTVGGGNTFNSGGWATGNKLDPNDYIQWSVTADPGYVIRIKEFQINFDRDPDGMSHFFAGNGPAKIRIRSSLDNYKSDLYANDKISNSGQSPNIETSLTSTPGGTITFRLYGFASNIGMLGDLGTLDIEGDLGEVLGLPNTGIRLSGDVTYDGLLFTQGTWTPHAPNQNTGDQNVLIQNGIFSASEKIQVKNLWVAPQAGIVIQKRGAITVNGNLTTSDNVVLQSDTDSFSSLIVKDTVIGTATYQRQVTITPPLGGAGNQILLSAPVTGELFNVFRANNPNIMSTSKTAYAFGPLNKTKGNYVTYGKSETAKLTPATGYKTAIAKNGTFTFTGTVQTDTVAKIIHHSGALEAPWNLIGNPYPSYVTVADFLAANKTQLNPNLFGIYSFDADPSNGWQVRNLAYLTMHPRAKMVPGEGFMVAAQKEGGQIIFTPEMRNAGALDPFDSGRNSSEEKVGFFKVHLTNGILKTQTDFYFNEQSTLGMDRGYDAGIYESRPRAFSIYSQLVEKDASLNLAIQSLPYAQLSDHTIIPLGLEAAQGQELTIQIEELKLPAETEIYLEDKLRGSFTLLNSDDYMFYTTSEVSGTGRFFLHVVNATLSYGYSDFDNLQVYTENGGRILRVTEKKTTNTLVTVFDMQERLLISVELDQETVKHGVDLSGLDSGMYLVKVKTGKLEKIKKIII